MALPSPASKANLDSSGDDPKLARPDLADLVDKFNSLLTVLGNIVELDAAAGIKDDGAGGIAIDEATDSGFEFATDKLRIKAIEGLQRKASNAGLALDLNGLVEETAIDLSGDWLVFYDTTAGLHRKIKPQNISGALTGEMKAYPGATAPTGYVLMEGGTIGSATSGASVRANADTEALFLLLWDNSTNAELPVSTGRGGSAAADWADNETITLPDIRGRGLIGTGTGGGLTARTNFDTGGGEDKVLLEANLPSTINMTIPGQTANSTTTSRLAILRNAVNNDSANVTITDLGSDTPLDTMSPWLAAHWIIKL